jgi:ring-1,2-phenylacetyl-CoA epoxidase subunit PaaD
MVAVVALEEAAYAPRLAARRASPWRAVFDLLDGVADPELPELSLWDLGVLRGIEGEPPAVVLVPTYTGCPAFEVMIADVRHALDAAGHTGVGVAIRRDLEWSTALMSRAARARLRSAGIAPPHEPVRCPVCGSEAVEPVARFGGTACKALLRCRTCSEPFEQFKEH